MARTLYNTPITKTLSYDEASFHSDVSKTTFYPHWLTSLLAALRRVKTLSVLILAVFIALYVFRILLYIMNIGILDLVWPFTYGVVMTSFTWIMTYLDSIQPGINPPMPLSPLKMRENSNNAIHVSYMLAIANGVFVFILASWWKEKELQ